MALFRLPGTGVDPLEDAQSLGPVDAAGDDGRMRALGLDDSGEAGQPVGDDMAARDKARLGVLADRFFGEAFDASQMDADRPALTGFNRGHERELVFAATP